MKNFLFLVGVTMGGGLGALLSGPFVPVLVYYFYACLRPHSLWKFQLSPYPSLNWSFYAAVMALASYLPWVFGVVNPNDPLRKVAPKFVVTHRCLLIFAAWQTLSYLNSNNQYVSYPWYEEFLKIFAIYLLSSQVLRSYEQIRWLYLAAMGALAYIAFDVVQNYLLSGYLVFYKRGYDGLDNNGAALMVAISIPMLYFAWEFTKGWHRWIFLALIPVVGEAVMSSYSRGAMLSVLASSPLYLIYTRKRKFLLCCYGAAAVAVPFVAGEAIEERFATMFADKTDESFSSREQSWRAARLIANDFPVFGAGIRCSNLLSKEYGADLQGRTIHNIYLQIAADSGWVGLGCYLLLVGSAILAMWQARRRLWRETDPESRRVAAMLGGLECALWTFLVGATFLSLETFEAAVFIHAAGRANLGDRQRANHADVRAAAQPHGPRRAAAPGARVIDDSRTRPTPIRVAFVVHVMQVAGAEVLVRETIRALGPAITPAVFCLDRVGAIGEELRAGGVDVVCFDRRPGWDFRASDKLAAAARARRTEVIHAHQYTPFFYAALAKPRIRPTPALILTEHGRHYPDVVGPPRRAVNRLVLDRLADGVNACCAFSARALCRTDGFRGNRIRVIENGIDFARYGPANDRAALRERLGLDPHRNVLIHVARHHPVKDQPTLLRGFAMAADDLTHLDLVLVGDGPQRAELTELARTLNVAGRVKFVGIQSNVADWLRAADAFALTSVSEAASLTLLEAMATGLPVIVSAVGGNGEIVRDGVEGLHFARGDTVALAACVRRLFGDPESASRMGAAGRARVEAKYQLSQTVAKYGELYARLAGRPLGLHRPPPRAVHSPAHE